ncbi:hypothetical protein Cgig2_019114 [Carnegiea gigantea]|uniref:Exostosin GT47 domain-containing protein n=1 Tax=Carnegiea gigantea TaxID=171969 RepID=A0A9Q1JMX8_9CARY|nr:hypothetical protein Cgig2_019114 [Carnegiea gigantea]
MAPWTWTQRCGQQLGSRRKLSLMLITLAFVTSSIVLMYLSFHLDMAFSLHERPCTPSLSFPPLSKVVKFNNDLLLSSVMKLSQNGSGFVMMISPSVGKLQDHSTGGDRKGDDDFHGRNRAALPSDNQLLKTLGSSSGSSKSKPSYNHQDVFHDKEIFLQNYKEMKKSLKVYIYPPKKNDHFANVFLPQNKDQNPGGNYASEAYFKNVLFKSHFITKNPLKADLFFLSFSIASLRHDRRVGVAGLQDFIRLYTTSITQEYPYWNRTGGADHFYVACHSIGRMAMEEVEQVKANAIQVVCSSSYFLPNYFTHKDVCLPQIWPRHEEPSGLDSSNRKKLAFFAGAMNSLVRKMLLQAWKNDSSIFAHEGRLKTPYSEQFLKSKYCLHLKGFEVNTARVADALYYGCVPVILADHYDLPFMDILNWRSFSVVIRTSDIPHLKKILEGISPEEYSVLHTNVLKVRRHFQWNATPLDFDTFYMVMYELWLRRSSIKVMS